MTTGVLTKTRATRFVFEHVTLKNFQITGINRDIFGSSGTPLGKGRPLRELLFDSIGEGVDDPVQPRLATIYSSSMAPWRPMGGGQRTHSLPALVIRPLTTNTFRDEAPFLLLLETPPTFGRSLLLRYGLAIPPFQGGESVIIRLSLGKSYWLTSCKWSNGLIPH